MTITFDKYFSEKFERKDKHLILPIYPLNHNLGQTESKIPFEFIFDTGAMMTMIPVSLANQFKYNTLPTLCTTVFGGVVPEACITVDFKRIPGLKIAKIYIEEVVVAIPSNPNEEAYHKFGINILGQNVLEYFNYYTDTANDRIYFQENPSPKPISQYTTCRGVR